MPTRKSRFWLNALLIVAALTLILVAGVAVLVVQASKTLPPVDYRSEYLKLVTPSGASEVNGWTTVSDLYDAVVAISHEFGVTENPSNVVGYTICARDENGTITLDEQSRKVLKALDDHAVPAMLDRLVGATYVIPPFDGTKSLMMQEYPWLSTLRALTRAESARMELAHDAGDDAAAIQSFKRMFALARAAESGGTLIHTLVGMAIRALTIESLHECLAARRPSSDVCRAYLAVIDQHVQPTFQQAIAVDRLITLDTIQESYTDPNREKVHWTPLPVIEASQAMSVDAVERHYQALNDATKLPDRECHLAMQTIDDQIDQLDRRYGFVKQILSGFARASRVFSQARMSYDAARLALALEIYYNDHAHYPSTLTELSPQYLPILPMDVAAPTETLGYRVLNADEVKTHRRRYLMYSRGKDGVDQHGLEPVDDGTSSTRNASNLSGYDEVLNRARKPIERPSAQPESSTP